MNYKFGWRKDINSDKDYKFSSIKNGLTKLSVSTSDYIINENFPVYDQLTLNSCVANATVGALEILMAAKSTPTKLSRLFVYWNARMYTKETGVDDGTYIRNAFDSLRTLGVCLESVWAYSADKVFAQPPLEAYREGNDNTLASFYRVDSVDTERLDDVETAIRANHPVVFGTAVSKAFTQYYDSGTVWTPPSSSVGNHAMVITGVRTVNGSRHFYIRNSWGDNWGESGHCWFDESYIMWDKTDDLWVPTMVPELLL